MKLPPGIEAAVLATPGVVVNGQSSHALDLPLGISEKSFQAEVRRVAEMLGWLCYHTTDSRRSPEGFPDLLMVRDRKVLVAELKVGNNKPTAAQMKWITRLDRAVVEADLWRPENWPAIQKILGRTP